jgi:chemotaxis protein methyltransferase CheR
MTEQEFDTIRRLLLEHSAIVLNSDKRYLVETRLGPLVQQHNLSSIGELLVHLRTAPENGLQRQIVEALVTSESSFFRDHHPFEALRKVVLPALIERRQDQRRLNIWCAASANGQEPYSLALLIREHFPQLINWKIEFLASDLSREVLARARSGRYSQFEVNRGLPATLLVKYFKQHGTDWELLPAVRSTVDFRELNLARPWPTLPRMDLVLLRNVMIYFDVETKKSILGRLARLLLSDGYLLLGGAETTMNLDDSYRRVEPLKAGFYQLVG